MIMEYLKRGVMKAVVEVPGGRAHALVGPLSLAELAGANKCKDA